MKSFYELLGVERSADEDTIKRAFRREIARYHPDKVAHLGREFQEMAVSRAAELTTAYKTLTDRARRAEYDGALDAGVAPAARSSAAPARAEEAPAPGPGVAPEPEPDPPAASRRFERERAGRDSILRRAALARVQDAAAAAFGDLDVSTPRGFDLALVPRAKPRFFGAPPPRILVRLAETASAAAAVEARTSAGRAGLPASKAPLIVLLLGAEVAEEAELTRALAAPVRGGGAAEGVYVVLVDVNTWSVRVPAAAPAAVRQFAASLHP